SSSLTTPSEQIAFCDTGYVNNDADLTTSPEDWTENSSSVIKGYVRFPLFDRYKETVYKSHSPWRPVPRHRGKTSCVMFDGSARTIPIAEIVNYEWGDEKCLFDNKPPHPPPCPPAVE
ncbi:MAG: hypothetical protein ACODAJ_05030, partial [Planctomycetota bacterium]